MSPIRPGINMALRDVIVAANHLVPYCMRDRTCGTDAALPQIQDEREPEIVRAQQLQSEEAAQAERLGKSALMRWAASQLALPASVFGSLGLIDSASCAKVTQIQLSKRRSHKLQRSNSCWTASSSIG